MVNIKKITDDDYKNRITGDDIEYVLRLLDEYSVKLRKSCDELKLKNSPFSLGRIKLFFTMNQQLLILSALLLSLLLLLIVYYGFKNSLILSSMISFSLGIDFFLIVRLLQFKKMDFFSVKHDADFLAEHLEELVRIASSAYEQLEMKRISRIELALKLFEAESALKYYNSIRRS